MLDPGPSLIAAAPYIERFRGQVVVVKLGGELLVGEASLDRIVPQLEVLMRCGLRPVVVHGGGVQIDQACQARQLEVDKVGGRRVTTPEVMEIVLEVVAGELNRALVEALRARGLAARGYAEGVSAAIRCTRRPPVEREGRLVDFGCVGDVSEIDTSVFAGNEWALPVLPAVGTTAENEVLNVNGDTVAARVAVGLKAQKLIMLSSVPGVMRSLDDAGPISRLTSAKIRELIDGGQAVGGMKAKLEEALLTIAGGVPQVHVISGLEPQTVLREIFTDDGCGTLITAGDEATA